MDKKSRIKRSARSKRLGGKAAVTVSKRAEAEIAYQNKDIASKFFTGQLKGKSFQVYGINVPEVKGLLPTNLPVIKVNELRIDNLLELASKIRNREQQVFVLAGILTFTDKIIDEKTAIKIRRLIQMTKVGMIIAKEQEEAVKAARDEERRKAQEAVNGERRKAWKTIKEEKQKNQEEKRDSVLKMLQDGLIPLQKIAEYSGMDIQAVTELARSVL